MNRSTVIKSSDQITDIFNTGVRFSSGLVRILVKKCDEQRGLHGRVAFIAGKKLGNAVVRNHNKRLLRAAAHDCGLPARDYDILLMATNKTKDVTSTKVASDLRRLLDKAGVI